MYLLAAPSCHAQDLLDPVQDVLGVQAGALHLAGDLLRQHVGRIRLGRLRCDALDGAVVRVFEVDPAGAAFQLAPAVLHLGDGEDALAGLALDRVAHARAAAIVQIRDNDADSEGRRREALDGLGSRFRCPGSAGAQDLIDGRSDGAVALVEVLARAGLVGVVAVHGHVAAVGVVDAVGLVGRPDQLLDAVALADVGHQLDQCGVGCIGHGVGVLGVTGDFDGDGAVVVLAAGSAPGAIRLIDGQTDGAILPIGYKVDAERHIVVDEREAAVVREAFKLHIAGGQIRDIVRLFADRGVMGRRGKPVSNAVVYRMLRNEKYLGEFYIQDVKLNVEPIIDQATFLEAARHFKTSRNNAAGRAKVNYLLSCKMFCGYCGSMISAEAGTGKLGKVYRYYKCGDKKRGKACELKPFPKDHLEDAIILATVNDMLTDEMIEKLTVRILEVQEQENADDPVVGLRRRLDSNKKRQRNLLDAIEEGGARGLVSRLAALEEEEEQLVLEIQRAEIKRPRLTHEVVEAWLRSFRVGDVTDDDFRARLVDTFIARVELRNDEALIFYNIREKGPHSRVRVRPEWWNSSELKKSSIVIPRPSQSFLIVETVALRFRPLMMLFTVDWVTPLMLQSLLMEISRSLHNSKIRSLTASPMFMGITSLH